MENCRPLDFRLPVTLPGLLPATEDELCQGSDLLPLLLLLVDADRSTVGLLAPLLLDASAAFSRGV